MTLDLFLVYILLTIIDIILIFLLFLFSKIYRNNKNIPKMKKDIEELKEKLGVSSDLK